MTATSFWTAPRSATDTTEWVSHYWDSATAPHRDIVVQLVGAFRPESVLEVGCHCGPNLRRLADAYPEMRCDGLDVNVDVVVAGRELFRPYGDRIRLFYCEFPHGTHSWVDGIYDLVFSCYSLAYIAPPFLANALEQMLRLAKEAVVIVEPSGTGQYLARGDYAEWRHDYGRELARVVRGRPLWHYAITPAPANGLDSVFIVGPQEP